MRPEPATLRRSRSLRFRLTLWYTGILAVILVCAAAAVFFGVSHALRAEADRLLAGTARRVVAATVNPGDSPDAGDLAETLNALGPAPLYARLIPGPGRGARVVSADLARRPTLSAPLDVLMAAPLPASGRFSFAGPDEEQLMRVYTVPLRGSPGGALQVAVPWDHSADLLERLGVLLLLGVPAVLLVVALGGWALIGRTLQPIARIVAEAERLDAEALPEALLPPAAETDSEIGHLVATLNRMTTRLSRAFEVQRRFAADASHELRTPLTILRGEMELALSRPRAPEVYKATLRSAVEEVARLSRIVEGLSFLARRDAGRGEAPRADVVDLAALAAATAAEYAGAASEKQVILRAEGEHRVLVWGSADHLRLLLGNLVGNALKYTPPGGDVTVEAQGGGQAAELIVGDTGIGISPADLPHVFDRFWRADPSRSSEGSGLGLAICAEIAAAHGGTLDVTSEPGRGSVFRLRLPAGGDAPARPSPGRSD